MRRMKLLVLFALWGAVIYAAVTYQQFVHYFLLVTYSIFASYSLLLMFLRPLKWRVNEQHVVDEHTGERLIRYVVERSNRFPLGIVELTVRWERSNVPHPMEKTVFRWVGFRKRWTYDIPTDNWERGKYTSKQATIRLSDSIHLGLNEATHPMNVSFYVHPVYRELFFDRFEETGMSSDGGTSMLFSQDVTIPTSTRPYVKGDSLSHIHWKETARRQQMMTKEFERGEEKRVALYFESVEGPYLEERIQLFASLVYTLVKQRAMIEVQVNDQPSLFITSDEDFYHFLHQLTVVKEKPYVARERVWKEEPSVIATVATAEQAAMEAGQLPRTPTVYYMISNKMDRLLERKGHIYYEWIPLATFQQMIGGVPNEK